MGKWKRKTVALVANLALLNKANPAVIPYIPSKTEILAEEEPCFRRVEPEKHGIHSGKLINMLTALENEPKANVHNLLVLKDGEIITECSAPGYSTRIGHLAHSMTKSLTGLAIGFLWDEGRISLEDKIISFFPEIEARDKRFSDITVRHALTMTTGVSFNEAGAISDTEWTKTYFGSRVTFPPGTMFAYNSMNTYILGRIVSQICGMSLLDFLKHKLFNPLGIKSVFWEIGPEGAEKGGWGIYLSAESWAKIALMMINDGVFENKRILSHEWIKESTTQRSKVPESAGGFNYGYHLWVAEDAEVFLFSGMLGQNIWMSKRSGIVAVINCENNELFQNSPSLEILKSHLSALDTCEDYDKNLRFADLKKKEQSFFADRMWAKPKAYLKGLGYKLGLRTKAPFADEWSKVLGKYTLAKNTQGLLPFFVRAMQNNYSGGISSLALSRMGENLYLSVVEGTDTYTLKVGFYDYETTVINFRGEKYITRAICEYTTNEHGAPLYKIALVFPEIPNSRRIAISFGSEGQIILKVSEMPNEQLAAPFAEGLYSMSPKLTFAIGLLERRLGDRFIVRRLESLFSPAVTGARDGSSNFDVIIDSENEKADMEKEKAEVISSLLMSVSDNIDDE